MELKHLPKYKHITEHAETYANIDAGSLELFLSLFDISKKMNHVMEHYFAGRGLSEGKFKILMLLFDAKDHRLSPTELCQTVKRHESDDYRPAGRAGERRFCQPQASHRG